MIYLVRHGQTDWNLKKKLQGHTDILLNETGRMQAREIAEKISKCKITKIICSDLARAKETAEIINEKIGCGIEVDKRLREFDYGDLEGKLKSDITKEMWEKYKREPQMLNAESNEDIFMRIKSFFDQLRNINENILIVTHGGALRMAIYYSENNEKFDSEKYEKYKLFKMNNGDILEWDKESVIKI